MQNLNSFYLIFFAAFILSSLSSCSNADQEELVSQKEIELSQLKSSGLDMNGPTDDPHAIVYLSESRDYSDSVLEQIELLKDQGKEIIYLNDEELKDFMNTPSSTIPVDRSSCISNSSAGLNYSGTLLFYGGSITTTAYLRWYGISIHGCGSAYYIASNSGNFDFYNNSKTVNCGVWANNRVFAYCGGWELGSSYWVYLG